MANLDQRQYSPAFQRNCDPILAVIKQALPTQGTILEIASGTGEHAAFLAQHCPHHHWLPSDVAQPQLASITAWRKYYQLANLYQPILIDVLQQDWPETVEQTVRQSELSLTDVIAIVNINMIHIAPWEATLGLLSGAARLLSPQGLLYLYGPFLQSGQANAPSNLAFDQSLRSRDPEWGIRSLDDVVNAAAQNGLVLEKTVDMPANNLSVVWRQS